MGQEQWLFLHEQGRNWNCLSYWEHSPLASIQSKVSRNAAGPRCIQSFRCFCRSGSWWLWQLLGRISMDSWLWQGIGYGPQMKKNCCTVRLGPTHIPSSERGLTTEPASVLSMVLVFTSHVQLARVINTLATSTKNAVSAITPERWSLPGLRWVMLTLQQKRGRMREGRHSEAISPACLTLLW